MKLKTNIIIILILGLFFSCKTVKSVQTKEVTKTTIKEVQKDSLIKIAKDSSYFKAWIECVKNKPMIIRGKYPINFPEAQKEQVTQGKYLHPPNVTLKNNVLEVDCKAKAQKLYIKWKEKFILEQSKATTTITLPPKLIEKKLSWWQKLWIAIGKITSAAVLIWLLTKVRWRVLFRLLPY